MPVSGRSQLGLKGERAPSRVIIEGVQPEIEQGRFPIKRTVGEEVVVTADIFAEGHDVLRASLVHRKVGEPASPGVPMTLLVNDHWTGRFVVSEPGRHEYAVVAWVDPFASWRRDLAKRVEA